MEELPDAVVSVSEEEAFAQSALNDGIPSILQKLPAMYREVLYLYYCEELSAKTVARLLSRRESTVRTQLQTGRALLRGIIEKGEAK
jgi:RNA polymerase sigma-70 factor (ECF subfamily)